MRSDVDGVRAGGSADRPDGSAGSQQGGSADRPTVSPGSGPVGSADRPTVSPGSGPVGSADRPALRRCIGMEPDFFATEHWARRPLLTTGRDFGDLFSLAAVDELLSRRGLRTPFLRLAKEGRVVESSRFTASGGAGADVADQVSDEKVLRLFLDGSTIVLQGLHRVWPPLIAFAQQLTTDLGHPVQVNAYVTPPENRGFSAHYDVHDVFVLQVAGQKRWKISEPVLPAPLRDQPWTAHEAAVAARAAQPPALETVLRPGDALYLPRGWLHAAEALGDVSAHLTVGVHPVTRYALVETLAALAASEPALRESLPLGIDVADPAQVGPQLAATVQALAGWLHTADPATVADRLRARVWSQGRAAPLSPLAQAAAVSTLDGESRVVLRPNLRYALRSAGDRVVLVLADRTIGLPAITERALKALLAGEPLRVAELPGLDPDDRLVLVRRLLREAVVVPA